MLFNALNMLDWSSTRAKCILIEPQFASQPWRRHTVSVTPPQPTATSATPPKAEAEAPSSSVPSVPSATTSVASSWVGEGSAAADSCTLAKHIVGLPSSMQTMVLSHPTGAQGHPVLSDVDSAFTSKGGVESTTYVPNVMQVPVSRAVPVWCMPVAPTVVTTCRHFLQTGHAPRGAQSVCANCAAPASKKRKRQQQQQQQEEQQRQEEQPRYVAHYRHEIQQQQQRPQQELATAAAPALLPVAPFRKGYRSPPASTDRAHSCVSALQP